MPNNIKDTLLKECLLILKREDIKAEIKSILSPFMQLILQEISLYLYLFVFFLLVIFLLHLGILIILLRNNKNLMR